MQPSPQQQQQPHVDQQSSFSDDKAPPKPPVVRGARACTVCRAAKMKCVGADDGNNIPCQRCKRSGADCIFEKHRRGRKPGSRLSEASKMLRRLEKGLNNAKQKSTTIAESLTLPPLHDSRTTDSRYRPDNFAASSSRFAGNELPPLNLPSHLQQGYARSNNTSDEEMDEDDGNQTEGGMYPARLIKQNARNSSFFKTILNPEQVESPVSRSSNRTTSADHKPTQPIQPPTYSTPNPPISVAALFSNSTQLKDPIDAGLIDEKSVVQLWDLFFLRLNPFICLFDPTLHTVVYVRSRCPFLFTALLMASCKFFRPELYQPILRLAHDFAVRAFAENWKRVEVVQAFACMTYWKEPDDTRTWTYIGYACRMAVELGLNRYVGKRPQGESDLALLERRNRERTYLVLFVHDRSLSMQTGKHWMLPEDELVHNCHTWHEEGGVPVRQEDVIVAAFTELRCIAAETTDVFNMHQGSAGSSGSEVNYEMLLRNCNGKLNQWVKTWQAHMQRAHGEQFQLAIMRFFQLHVRLFLNTFGINTPSPIPGRPTTVNVEALNTCYTSAMENLGIMAEDFARMQTLPYGQDSTTVMTAYSAVVLLKLLRSDKTLLELKKGATEEIHAMIEKTATAYLDASRLSPASSSAAYHARFLQSLVVNDINKQQQTEQDSYKREMARGMNGGHASSNGAGSHSASSGATAMSYGQMGMYGGGSGMGGGASMDTSGYFSQNGSGGPLLRAGSASSTSSSYTYAQPEDGYAHGANDNGMGEPVRTDALTNYSLSGISTTYAQYQAQYQAQPVAEHNALYWRNMFKDLGFGGGATPTGYGYHAQGQSGVVGVDGAAGQQVQGADAAYGLGTAVYRDGENVYQGHPAQTQAQYGYPMYSAYSSR